MTMKKLNDRVHYGLMVVLDCLHITQPHNNYHYVDVSHGIAIYGAVYSAYPFTYDYYESTCTVSCYHHKIGSLTDCLGLVHETLVCSCMSFFLFLSI